MLLKAAEAAAEGTWKQFLKLGENPLCLAAYLGKNPQQTAIRKVTLWRSLGGVLGANLAVRPLSRLLFGVTWDTFWGLLGDILDSIVATFATLGSIVVTVVPILVTLGTLW